MRNYYGPTFGEKTTCFLCDFWWLILIILVLLVTGGILGRTYLPQLFPTPTPTITATPQPTATRQPTATLEPTSTPQEPVLGTGDIQVTLRWNDTNDLDLWVIDPNGEKIYYGNSISASHGQLDVDTNLGCGQNITSHGVENIFWPDGESPNGHYQVIVNLYQQCDPAKPSSDYSVVINQHGVETTYTGTVSVNERKDIVVDFEAQ